MILLKGMCDGICVSYSSNYFVLDLKPHAMKIFFSLPYILQFYSEEQAIEYERPNL